MINVLYFLVQVDFCVALQSQMVYTPVVVKLHRAGEVIHTCMFCL